MKTTFVDNIALNFNKIESKGLNFYILFNSLYSKKLK